jgi:hypothetical protein
MALVQGSSHRRSKDLHVCGLALVVLAIIAAAVPILQVCVNTLFGMF